MRKMILRVELCGLLSWSELSLAASFFLRDFISDHAYVQADVKRHKKIVPVAGKQMRNAGKA